MIEQRIQDILREKAALDEELQVIRKGLVGKKVRFNRQIYIGNEKWLDEALTGVVELPNTFPYNFNPNSLSVQGAIGYYVELKDIIEVMEK